MTVNTPLSPEERALLGELNLRDAIERWQEAEDARVQKLAVLAHLDGLIDLPLTLTRLAAVEASTGDIVTKVRIGRVRTILTTDLATLLDQLEQLKVPSPMPVAPEPPEQEPE